VFDPAVVDAATTSVLSASITTVITTAFGLPLAYWLARTDGFVTKAILAIVVLPLVLPPTVGGIVLLTVFGPGTAIGDLAIAAGVPLTRSLAGVVLAQTFVASPFVVVTAKAAFESVDRTLEYASRSLGKSRWTTARHVTLPLAGPGILAGVTLAFARAMGEFGATMMMAYYPRTMPVQIWVAFIELGLDNAYPVAILLVGIAAVALVVLNTVASNPWE
jgi:molybdate/tungstate transport system permease protein